MARPPPFGELNKVVRSQEGLLKFEDCEKNASKTVRRNESLLIIGASRTSPPTMSSGALRFGFENPFPRKKSSTASFKQSKLSPPKPKTATPLFLKIHKNFPCRPERGHKGLFWGGTMAETPQVTLTTMRLIRTKGVFRTVGSKSLSPSALARLQERTRIPPQTIIALFTPAEKLQHKKTIPLTGSHHQSFVTAGASPRPTV